MFQSTTHEGTLFGILESEFIERLDEVNAHLVSLGLPQIEKGNATKGNKGLKSRFVEGGQGIEGATKH